MDLLAEASGIVQSLRILSMFDRQFQKLWSAAEVEIHLDQRMQVSEVELENGEVGDSSILVSWGDCVMADYFTLHNPGTVLEYTVEISPETEIPIKSFQYYKSLIFTPRRADLLTDKSPNSLLESHSFAKYSARFDGLKPGTSYDIQVATELAGKTVVQTRHTFKTLQADTESASSTETQEDTVKSGPG